MHTNILAHVAGLHVHASDVVGFVVIAAILVATLVAARLGRKG